MGGGDRGEGMGRGGEGRRVEGRGGGRGGRGMTPNARVGIVGGRRGSTPASGRCRRGGRAARAKRSADPPLGPCPKGGGEMALVTARPLKRE